VGLVERDDEDGHEDHEHEDEAHEEGATVSVEDEAT
jgi:hypothetical protein